MATKRKQPRISDDSKMAPYEREFAVTYAIFLKAVNYPNHQIGKIVGVSTGVVKKWFADKRTAEKVVEVQAKLTDHAVALLQTFQIESVQGLMEIARDKATDNKTRKECYESILDRGGLTKVNKSESAVTKTDRVEVGISAEMFDELQGLPLETQQQLAELSAQMEELIANAKGQG